MTLEELFKAIDTIEFSKEDIARIQASLDNLDEQFQKQAKSMQPTAEMLNRLYTL